ncbi:MAG: hypothetical protein WA004_20395 [Saprospiraceae bacterium]
MKKLYTRANVIRGAVIYTAGDTVAALILGDFLWTRMLGISLVGALVYALEIPHYFQWIDRRQTTALSRTALAMLYFNPLWIARHLFFIYLFSGQMEEVGWGLLAVAGYSFLANIPLSLLGNYVVQNVVRLPWRFFASAVFSALMAVYYALSAVVFRF